MTIEGGYGWLAAVAVANTVASLFYYLRVIGLIYFADDTAVPVLGRWARAAAITAGIAVTFIGLAAGPLLDALSRRQLLP